MEKKPQRIEVEFKFDRPEDFKLVVQQTTDGDRATREAAQKEADKQEAEKRQTSFA